MCEYIYGCTNPLVLNYNPAATHDYESCSYPNIVIIPPTFAAPLPIPVTGFAEDLYLIPVTGIDQTENGNFGLFEVVVLLSVFFTGTGIVLLKVE